MSRLVRSGGQPRAMAGRAWVFTVVRGPGGGAAVCTAGEARERTGQSPVSGAFLASANGDVKTRQKCKSGAAELLRDPYSILYRGCPRVGRPVFMILQKIRFVKN